MIVNCGFLVFLRRSGAHGLGHVGWGFRRDTDGAFNIGAVENELGTALTAPTAMNFWTVWTHKPLQYVVGKDGIPSYDEYKFVPLGLIHPVDAASIVVWIARQAYCVATRNCMDDAYDVIRAYSAERLLTPSDVLAPNYWFDALAGKSHLISDPSGIPAPLGEPVAPNSTHLLSDFARLDHILKPSDLETTPSLAPAWRIHGTAASIELAAAVDEQRQRRMEATQVHKVARASQQSGPPNIEEELQEALVNFAKRL